jgi:hypothetical protein
MGTGASTAVQQVVRDFHFAPFTAYPLLQPQPQIDERMVVYSTKNITLTPGTWKVRQYTHP